MAAALFFAAAFFKAFGSGLRPLGADFDRTLWVGGGGRLAGMFATLTLSPQLGQKWL